MIIPSEIVAMLAGLGSAFSWGVGDFSGGLAARKANIYSVVLIAEVMGAALLAILAVTLGEPLPPMLDMAWAVAAGITGTVGLAALYQSMALGQMGIAAPVAAMVGAGIPVIAGAILEGLPGPLKLIGFAVGLAGLWLISLPEKIGGTAAGFRLAILAGLGFAGFFIFIHQASGTALFWPLVCSRSVAMIVMIGVTRLLRQPLLPGRDALPAALLAGLFDVGGNVFYTLSAQTGRLDVAAVLSSAAPMFTILMAMIVVKERLNRGQAIGIGLLLAAIVMFALPQGG